MDAQIPSRLSLAPVSPLAQLPRNSGKSFYDHRSNTVWIGNDVPQELFASVVAHELNHFLVHASTPYGWFLDECVALENNLVLSYCLDHYHRYPPAPIDIPIYDVAVLAAQDRTHPFLRELCEKHTNPWSHVVFLQRLLEGEDSPDLVETTARQATQSFNLVEDLAREKNIVEQAGMEPAQLHRVAEFNDPELDKLRAMPFIIFDKNEINLGARNVFESIAIHHESKDSIVSSLQAGSRTSYWALWMHTVSKMGKDRVRSEQDYARLVNTFYSLCDLALFVPAGAVYGRLRTEDMQWFDLQPAARFMTALRQAATLGWVEDLEKGMLPYQEWLSELLHWPSPKHFLELGAALPETDRRQSRHARACRIRLENHSAFIVLGKEFEARSENPEEAPGLFSIRKFFADNRPMVYTPRLGRLIVEAEADSPTEALSRLLDWFFVRFNYQIMRKGVFGYEELLPDDVQYDSIWRNIRSREELIATLQQAIPALTPDRFQAFDNSLL
jgi:hypothetical protein